jgi:hypothetical protein
MGHKEKGARYEIFNFMFVELHQDNDLVTLHVSSEQLG